MDALTQLAFSFRRMVAALLRLLPGEYVAELDFESARPLRTVHIGEGRGREPRVRSADLLWSFEFVAAAGHPPWARGLLAIEHQSTVDRHLALRVQTYCALVRQSLLRDKRLIGPNGELPQVLPLAIHTGARSWTAPRTLAALTGPGPAAWAPAQPDASYLLLDDIADLDAAWPGNPAAALIRLQRASDPRDVPRLAADLGVCLRDQEDVDLRRDLNHALRSQLASKFGPTAPALPAQLLEEDAMLSERMDQWREDAVREGQRRGLAEGQLEGQRTALNRMAAHRFDVATVAGLSARLAAVDDPSRLAAAGDLVATCTSGRELLRRLGPSGSDS